MHEITCDFSALGSAFNLASWTFSQGSAVWGQGSAFTVMGLGSSRRVQGLGFTVSGFPFRAARFTV